MQKLIIIFILIISFRFLNAQVRDSTRSTGKDTVVNIVDTTTRIINLNPFFSLHVDSSLSYHLLINKNKKNYFWYLKNAPVGLRIDKDNGLLSFKANKDLFRSGRLKYDTDYPVKIGVQNLINPGDNVDTSFTITWYNTDVIVPRIKPSVVSPVIVEEGNKLSFNVMCENGNFPIDKILFSSSLTINNYKIPKNCDDGFEWVPPYDFVTEKDANKEKTIDLFFVGTTKFNFADTARVRVIVKESLNYDIATSDYKETDGLMRTWIKQLKYTFVQLDKRVRKTKNARSVFDIASATSTVSGTIISTTSTDPKNPAGKILPSAGVVLLPVKEAAAPNKTAEQNQAGIVRSTIKRLEYIMTETRLSGEKDPQIIAKTEKLKNEYRQSKTQLAEVPTDMAENIPERDLDSYFNSRKVQKKYRLK